MSRSDFLADGGRLVDGVPWRPPQPDAPLFPRQAGTEGVSGSTSAEAGGAAPILRRDEAPPPGSLAGGGSHPQVDSFLAYWQSRRGWRAMPLWRDIDPVGIPVGLLPHLVVWTVRPEPLDFYCVLAGDHVVTHYGVSPHRRWLSSLIRGNPSVETFRDRLRLCFEQRRPLVTWDRFIGRDGFEKISFGAVAPLSEGGATPDRLVCCAVYKELAIWAPSPPFPPQSVVEIYRPAEDRAGPA